MNPRDLTAFAEIAMMTAKAEGKDRVLVYDSGNEVRPNESTPGRHGRSIAHLKMLQSLAGNLNRLNDVREIGATIAGELRTLIEYHFCRVYVLEGETLVPVAVAGGSSAEQCDPSVLETPLGEGVAGHVAATGRSLRVPNSLESDMAIPLEGPGQIEESILAVPLTYGARVSGVIFVSKLGVDQFDEDDLRLLEVLAGHASVALENARLYKAQRREAANARSLLNFADSISRAHSVDLIADETVASVARLLDAQQVSLWVQEKKDGPFLCRAHLGHAGDPRGEAFVGAPIPAERGMSLMERLKGPFPVSGKRLKEPFRLAEEVDPGSLVVSPLKPGDGLWGALLVRPPQNAPFSAEDMRLLSGLCYQAAAAMEKARLYNQQKEAAEIANALLVFGRDLSEAPELDAVLQRTVELTAQILGSPRTSVWLQEIDSDHLAPQALWGYDEEDREAVVALRVPIGSVERWFTSSEPFVMSYEDRPNVRSPLRSPPNVSFAVVPLVLEGGCKGMIAAAAAEPGPGAFSERQMRLFAGIGSQAKLAIGAALRFQALERTFMSTVEALAGARERRDQQRPAHAGRINELAIDVGHELRLGQEALKEPGLGARWF